MKYILLISTLMFSAGSWAGLLLGDCRLLGARPMGSAVPEAVLQGGLRDYAEDAIELFSVRTSDD